jgi:hypothetical protein
VGLLIGSVSARVKVPWVGCEVAVIRGNFVLIDYCCIVVLLFKQNS